MRSLLDIQIANARARNAGLAKRSIAEEALKEISEMHSEGDFQCAFFDAVRVAKKALREINELYKVPQL